MLFLGNQKRKKEKLNFIPFQWYLCIVLNIRMHIDGKPLYHTGKPLHAAEAELLVGAGKGFGSTTSPRHPQIAVQRPMQVQVRIRRVIGVVAPYKKP